MLVAMRRSIRVGAYAGRPLEELGIEPDHRHYTTRRDIMGNNEDLIERAAELLRRQPVYSLDVKTMKSRGAVVGVITASTLLGPRDRSRNIARVDVYLDGQPVKSIPAERGAVSSERVSLGVRSSPKVELRIEAYDLKRSLVAVARKQA